jgi:hypothetical protein
VRAVPTEGYVQYTTPRRRALRLRQLLTSAAGPGANLAVVAAVVVSSPSGAFWPTVALTNAWLALCSLLPMDDPQRGIRTDGAQLLATLFARRSRFDELVALSAWYDAAALQAAGRTGEALDRAEAAPDLGLDVPSYDELSNHVGTVLATAALDAGRPALAERLARHGIRRARSGEQAIELRTTLAAAILERLDARTVDDPRLADAVEYARAAVDAGGGPVATEVLERARARQLR